MSESAKFVKSIRRCETIRFGSVPYAAREFGGYNNYLPEYLEVVDGKRDHLGTCFKENLAYLRQRNNPRDRLIIAQIDNGHEVICHCFIVNGNNLHDHSNYRRKCLDLDGIYYRANRIVQYCEPSREQLFNEPITANDLKACCRDMVSGKREGTPGPIPIRTGDWDIAAKLVTGH